jgi:hypothetical protein
MVLKPEQKYPHLLSKRLNWDLRTAAIAGSCNRRIIRSTIRDCVNLSTQDQIFALIQLTHLHRTEYAGFRTADNQYKYSYNEAYFENDMYEGLKPNDYTGLPKRVKDWVELGFSLHNEDAEFTRLCSDVLGLTAFLKSKNINYCIFSGPANNLSCDDTLYKELQQDTKVLDLLEFNMLGLTGKQVHPTEEGMQLIADYFFNLLCEQV